MQSQVSPNYQKKIKDYVISYAPSQFYGKNIHGQIRTGYKHKQNKVYLFRITQLPLTPTLTLFLQLQEQYSGLNNFARNVYEPVHSSANHYQPLEYFPKTFYTEREAFKKNSKYLDEYVQKFLRVYAFFYNMRVPHGNLTLHNIGITFEGKVKLMDFGVNVNNQSFQRRTQQDFMDFKECIGQIMEKDDNFPAKFVSFNSEQTSNWPHLFGIQHISSPLQPLYLPRKAYIDNIVTLLHKLYLSLQQQPSTSRHLLLALRLLMLRWLSSSQQPHHLQSKATLSALLGPLSQAQTQKLLSVILGAIQDPFFYKLSPEHRLLLITTLLPQLNHEYAYHDIIQEFGNEDHQRNLLLGDSLINQYQKEIYKMVQEEHLLNDHYSSN